MVIRYLDTLPTCYWTSWTGWRSRLPISIPTRSTGVRDLFWPTKDIKKFLTKSTEINKLAAKVRELKHVAVFFNSSNKWAASAMAPDTVSAVLDDDSLLFESVSSTVDDEKRITRVSYYYDPSENYPGTGDESNEDSYQKQVKVINTGPRELQRVRRKEGALVLTIRGWTRTYRSPRFGITLVVRFHGSVTVCSPLGSA